MEDDFYLDLLNGFQTIANSTSDTLISFTKVINDGVGSTPVDAMMDSVSGIGHRVKFGHSLDNLPVIIDKFGFSGTGDYFLHIGKDFASPHGIPIPFADQIRNATGISVKQSVDWLCVNIGDVVSGGLSVYHSYTNAQCLLSAMTDGYLPPVRVFSTAIGAGVKITMSVLSPNPISLASGVFDVGVLAYALTPVFTLGKAYFSATSANAVFTVTSGTAAGAAAGAATGGTLLYFKRLWGGESSFSEKDIGRIKKWAFCGACGGLAGSMAALVNPEPITVSTATVMGFVGGEIVYEHLFEKEPDGQGPVPDQANTSWVDGWPDFLAEAYA